MSRLYMLCSVYFANFPKFWMISRQSWGGVWREKVTVEIRGLLMFWRALVMCLILSTLSYKDKLFMVLVNLCRSLQLALMN